MISFLPVAILAYILNGLSTTFDKILLKKSLPSAFVYVFYISLLGGLAIFLLPFGIQFNLKAIVFGVISGIFANFALLAYFQALKKGEASVVAPIVGGLNPLFALIIGGLFLGQILNPSQLIAFALLLLGAIILTANIWSRKLGANHQLILMTLSGLTFALSYVFLKETFAVSNFFSGLFFSRLAGLFFILGFLAFPKIRADIFEGKIQKNGFLNKTSVLLLIGQAMGALSALLINFAITLTSPALVNSFFGFQYLTILIVATVLAKEHRGKLLDEDLSKKSLAVKVVGAVILSIGVYLLSK